MTNTSVNAANIFQSTHPVRGATGHAPLTEMTPQISIHAPREGCDRPVSHPVRSRKVFQSTHPVRGATCSPILIRWSIRYFNPRTP